jgi:uncharacterized protein YeaO (DUF488 family)
MRRRARSKVKLKRAYDVPARSDGRRVLVDRLWPRGISKDKLLLDDWLKDVAPSAGLRKWFGHDPEKWSEFRKRYFRELDERSDVIQRLLARGRGGTLTLVFAAKDVHHNDAVALKEYLEWHAGKQASARMTDSPDLPTPSPSRRGND